MIKRGRGSAQQDVKEFDRKSPSVLRDRLIFARAGNRLSLFFVTHKKLHDHREKDGGEKDPEQGNTDHSAKHRSSKSLSHLCTCADSANQWKNAESKRK
jgi:hypothetical protein